MLRHLIFTFKMHNSNASYTAMHFKSKNQMS